MSDAPTAAEPVFDIDGVSRYFPVGRGDFSKGDAVRAVDGVTMRISARETLGIVGESGSGKSTLARLLVRLDSPTSGQIRYRGTDLASLVGDDLRRFRSEVQMVFQDPYASLNPRQTAADAITEGWKIHPGLVPRSEWRDRLHHLLNRVGLAPSFASRYPHELSGGQQQRVGIARALALNPSVLVCDEPVSALDVSIQAQVINLFKDIQDEFQLTIVFVAHDLSVVRTISDRVAVMYLGKIMELGDDSAVYEKAVHPYTQSLLSAVPEVGGTERGPRIVLRGDPPSPIHPPSGCRFRTRCFRAQPECAQDEPDLIDRGHGHPSACLFAAPLPANGGPAHALTSARHVNEQQVDPGVAKGPAQGVNMRVAFARYLLGRLAAAGFTIFFVVTLAFFLIRLLGDPVFVLAGPTATQEDIVRIRHQYGLDQSAVASYFSFLRDALHGDFGESMREQRGAMRIVFERLPETLKLTALAFLFTLIIAVPIGILSALRPRSIFDAVGRFLAVVGQAVPVFVFGLLLILLFSVQSQVLPSGGSGTFKHLIMPALSLGLISVPIVMRVLRSSLLEVLSMDFMRFARSKGLGPGRFLFKHALRNAALPVITVLGYQFGFVIGGAVIVELVFTYPGMGQLAANAITAQDYPVIQAFLVVVAAMIVVTNLLLDLSYTIIDPRTRIERHG